VNYHSHYNRLIGRAKTRLIEGYTELHHILPKCMGGLDNPDNLVRLTAEEHFVAHQLLIQMYPGNMKLVYAASLMTTDRLGNRVNNKLYGWIRRQMSESRKGWNPSDETRARMSAWQIGKKLPNEHKQKISAAMTGRVFSEEHKQNLSLLHKGRTISEEHKQKLSASQKGKKQIKICCKYCGTVGGTSNMKRWHFENCKQKGDSMTLTN